MKLVIFAGGFGSRIGERSLLLPKPMIEIGHRPVIWHIMKYYSAFGINEFIICLGYKSEIIKDYFLHYQYRTSDFTIDIGQASVEFHNQHEEGDWKITLVDTGINALKGARLKKVERYLDSEINLMTYGDGVSNIDINKLINFHKENNKMVTLSGVHPPARFGELISEGNVLQSFEEKAQTSQGMINGGFMVFNKSLLEHLSDNDNCDLESGTFEKLAKNGEISVFKHDGLWGCMDHERDVKYLNDLWDTGKAFWKAW